ncbi:hypothetical protein ASPACDRAFT_43290 [Aspergillus aculeatus ATCC 16872]|uniref:Uncharacterized protein n=1 Tax=Aspergillus aculeatus (strain ATCC 16872 / CBS 172.66 / WB 5094) TaxID=690307 RepID=A0A1L9WU59_ASPA1|nr:uncharacterized protein ASPACDRAFT_43290 [Aspergillus aculeatus ATCC 16872]OJJ99663.1 hypothetical protein ASPACDRAFT_43290 [Aspergillus aculeatus ATCC 16872]
MATPIPWGYLAGELIAIWLAFGAACVLGLLTCMPPAVLGYNMCGDDWYWFDWLSRWILVTLLVLSVLTASMPDPVAEHLALIWFSLGSACWVWWLFCLFLNLLWRNTCDEYEFWMEWFYTWLDVTVYIILFLAFWHTIMHYNPNFALPGFM